MHNPMYDAARSFEERIDWLLENLTVEEKLGWMSSGIPGCERLGIAGFGLGGEAAHGIEARNDQWRVSAPDLTTSFPQPIGMSATWDPELIRRCGEVVGTEARVVNKRHPGHGLSRWAPTVDLARDPRWGRNEECYGEDPVLAGTMAGGYIHGMQGEDGKYVRCAATLKHFYANNTEEGRAWKNSSVSPRNKYELYLEPFRRCIEDANAQGVMTAYNRINGQVGILNGDVQRILKEQYGLTHVVGDGGALNLVVSAQHQFGSNAESVAAALKAGVDGMSDDRRMVEAAAREAYALGLIDESDLNRAIRSKLMVAMRAGHFDGDSCPYAHYTEADICTEEADALALRAAEESLVLLKNDGLLPLASQENAALIGPMAQTWYPDWYGGEPPCKKTIRDGMEALHIQGEAFDGWHRVRLMFGDRGIAVNEEGAVCLSTEPDVFTMEDWGENCCAFRSVRTGKYLSIPLVQSGEDKDHGMRCTTKMPYNWFVLELFHLEEADGRTLLLNCFHWPMQAEGDGFVYGEGCEGTPVTIEIVEDGIVRAAALARESDCTVLALGQCPMIPAKEERDRHTLLLPPHQRQLMEAVHEANPRTALVLVANYPHALPYASAHLPAILQTASGCQHLGTAVANALYGLTAPAGRLNMTWYRSDDQLPDMDDYDIIQGKRTYRYFDGDVLYPFGHGLTYTDFRYSDFAVSLRDDRTLAFTFCVENTGSTPSDEVAQVYAVAPASRVKKPLRQLVAFRRLHAVQPGEVRRVELTAPVDELRFYDVISRRLMAEKGEYAFFAGPSSAVQAVNASLFIPGEMTGTRDMKEITPADHYDESCGVVHLQGTLGFDCVSRQLDAEYASVTYRDCRFDEDCGVLALRVKSVREGRVTVLMNGQEIGRWAGSTRTSEHRSAPALDRFAYREIEARARERQPIWEDIDFPLPENAGCAALEIRLEGDVMLSFLRARPASGTKKVQLGIAN